MVATAIHDDIESETFSARAGGRGPGGVVGLGLVAGSLIVLLMVGL